MGADSAGRNFGTPLGATLRRDASARSRFTGSTLVILIGVAAVLKIGQEIFVPLALSLLLTFTLAPIVSFLRKRSVPKIAAVILAVASAFCAIGIFSVVVATQVTNLADNIPTYQRNIVTKVQALAAASSGSGVLDHLSQVVERVGTEIQNGQWKARMRPPRRCPPCRKRANRCRWRSSPAPTRSRRWATSSCR